MARRRYKPKEIRRLLPRRPSVASAASRSAVRVARVNAASTIRALPFSIKRLPMKHSRLDWPSPLTAFGSNTLMNWFSGAREIACIISAR